MLANILLLNESPDDRTAYGLLITLSMFDISAVCCRAVVLIARRQTRAGSVRSSTPVSPLQTQFWWRGKHMNSRRCRAVLVDHSTLRSTALFFDWTSFRYPNLNRLTIAASAPR